MQVKLTHHPERMPVDYVARSGDALLVVLSSNVLSIGRGRSLRPLKLWPYG